MPGGTRFIPKLRNSIKQAEIKSGSCCLCFRAGCLEGRARNSSGAPLHGCVELRVISKNALCKPAARRAGVLGIPAGLAPGASRACSGPGGTLCSATAWPGQKFGVFSGRDGAGEGRRRLPPAFLGWPSAAAARLALITAPKELEAAPGVRSKGRGAARGAQAVAPRRLPTIRHLGVPNLASFHSFPNAGSSPGWRSSRAGTQRGSCRHPNAFQPAAPSATEPPARRQSPIPLPLIAPSHAQNK